MPDAVESPAERVERVARLCDNSAAWLECPGFANRAGQKICASTLRSAARELRSAGRDAMIACKAIADERAEQMTRTAEGYYRDKLKVAGDNCCAYITEAKQIAAAIERLITNEAKP